MPRQNIIFAIVAPLVLMAIIAVIVVGIGETLLAVHECGERALPRRGVCRRRRRTTTGTRSPPSIPSSWRSASRPCS